MPGLSGVYLMRKTFVSTDPSLKALSPINLRDTLGQSHLKANFLSMAANITDIHTNQKRVGMLLITG